MDTSRENRLVELLKKAQNRLRNHGDVRPITLKINLLLHDEIERELGGDLFLAEAYAPMDDSEGTKV